MFSVLVQLSSKVNSMRCIRGLTGWNVHTRTFLPLITETLSNRVYTLTPSLEWMHPRNTSASGHSCVTKAPLRKESYSGGWCQAAPSVVWESPLSQSLSGPQTQPLYRGLPPNKNVQSHSFKMLQAALGEGKCQQREEVWINGKKTTQAPIRSLPPWGMSTMSKRPRLLPRSLMEVQDPPVFCLCVLSLSFKFS